MGTGWRRAFCTTIPRDPSEPKVSDQKQRSPSPSPSPRTRLSFFSSGGSNPSTPRLRCKTKSEALLKKSNSMPTNHDSSNPNNNNNVVVAKSPRVAEIKTSTTPKSNTNPNSPRSPLKLSLFKNSFKFRSSCGICLNSVKSGQGTAIYTAECSHAFHFPCVASYVRSHGSLVCPVCSCVWKDVPLLAMHKTETLDTPRPMNTTSNEAVSAPLTPPKVVANVEVKNRSPRYTLKPYDDDEPLLSPRVGDRIVPIPEAEEEEDEEVEEFRGFFVNPNVSGGGVKYSDDPEMSNVRDFRSNNVLVTLLPEAALLSSGRGFETYAVALRAKAPSAPVATRQATSASILDPSHRAPIDLVTVLDASGSMTGGKLQMLKRAMRLVISSLGSADRLSIVAFSATPKRLMLLKRMTANGQRLARRVVDRLVCGQGSSVAEALRKAAKVLEDRRERNPVASIMLLSDGQGERVSKTNNSNNSGSANQQHHGGSNDMSSTRFAHIEIPVHAFGFGQNAGYCQEPAEDAYAKCVRGLLRVVVQDLRVQLGFASGSAPAEITAIYSCNGRPTVHGSASIRLGDLYAEEERELLVELRIPTSAAGTHHVMSARCLYKDPATSEVVYGKEQWRVVPLPQTAVRSVTASNPKIQRLRSLFITTRAVAESRRLVEHNDFQSAHHLLASTRALLMQSGVASVEEYIRALDTQLAELHWKRQNQLEEQQMIMQRRRMSEREMQQAVDENGEPLTPTSAWRTAEQLAKVAMMKKSLNRFSDLHGFENARF